MAKNPWVERHVAGEMNFYEPGEVDPSTVRKMVESEYEGIEPVECDCGRTAYYRATVGAIKCECGKFYHTNGEPY